MWSSAFPLAHVVVRVSVSVTIVVPMKEATKEALALHKLRKGERERDQFVCVLCVPSERVLSQEGPLVSDIQSPDAMSNCYLDMLSCSPQPHVLD